ncbi:MAG: GYD family protein [Gemmatimonadetes bacterium]|nr:GYD family protein [Gemmatimonadota bacterium]
MPRYVLMTRLSPELMQDPRGRKAIGKEWKRRVDRLCPEVRWIEHYALLGPYDFMDVYEATDDEVAHKVSLISRTAGALSAESWPAIRYERFLALAETIEEETHSGG